MIVTNSDTTANTTLCSHLSGGRPTTRAHTPRLQIWLVSLAIVAVLVTSSCRSGSQAAFAPTAWHDFHGTWTATGTRQVLTLADRRSAISSFNGTLLLSGPSRPNVGFRAEAIVFNDTATGMIGRAVWTDEHGDQAFSELRGEGDATHNKIIGTFVGGTGRYAGATGSYEFSWQFQLEDEDGTVKGQSVGLIGHVRVDPSRVGGPQS